jgi:hypothetical protein
MKFVRGNFRLTRVILCLALATAVSVPAIADDTWHNVYHSLKHFFTGKSGSSPTPTTHHHVKHAANNEKTEEAPQASPSPSASVTTAREVVLPPGESATPRIVVLPASTPAPTPAVTNSQNIAGPGATPNSSSEQPTPPPPIAIKSTYSASKSDSATAVEPVLRSLSDKEAAASPTPTP